MWVAVDGRRRGLEWDRGGAVIDGGDGWAVTRDSSCYSR